MWNSDTLFEYIQCVDDLLLSPKVRAMNQIKQHAAGINCLDHCLFVSYVSYCICKKLGYDERAAARAGLLHDMHLCDWHAQGVGPWRRLVIHPGMALENAKEFGLTELEQDIILHHMWPVTIRQRPRHKEAAVVSLADKLCATVEMLRIYPLFGVKHNLVRLNPCRAGTLRY